MVVDAEEQKNHQDHSQKWAGEVCSKKDLTGPTLLEITGFPTQSGPRAMSGGTLPDFTDVWYPIPMAHNKLNASYTFDELAIWRTKLPDVKQAETKLVYASHLEGIDVIDPDDGSIAYRLRRESSVAEYGAVDVKQKTIYALTNDGYVYALRQPAIEPSNPTK